jgi:hypothetical protein
MHARLRFAPIVSFLIDPPKRFTRSRPAEVYAGVGGQKPAPAWEIKTSERLTELK